MKRTLKTRTLCLLLVLLMAAALLPGCQPTPEEEFVVNRLDGALEEAVLATPAPPAQYEAPERWTESFDVRGQTVRIDVAVEVPDAVEYPVLTVKGAPFTAEDVVQAAEVFFGGPVELREPAFGREEILYALQYVQQGKVVDEDPETGEPIFGPYEGQEEDIARLKAQLAAVMEQEETVTPLTAETAPLPAAAQPVRAETGDTGYFYCMDNSFWFYRHLGTNVQPELWVLQGDAIYGEKPHALENVKITEEEAVAMGDAFVKKLGRDDLALAICEKARSANECTLDTIYEGYQLTYVPAINGSVPCYFDRYSNSPELAFTQEQAAFSDGWWQESIILVVTEDGVQDMSWSNRKEIVNTANENVTLLPFDEIQEHIRRLLKNSLRGGGSFGDLIFERMMLSTALCRLPDQPAEALLVPVWAILLTTEHDREQHLEYDLLLINALDGTYINRWA